jgi:hypothetical protein
MDAPERYEIRIEGHLSDSWAAWFEGLEIRQEESGETVLSGPLADQTALHGVLMRIRDLGLPLVSVVRTMRDERQESATQCIEEGRK